MHDFCSFITHLQVPNGPSIEYGSIFCFGQAFKLFETYPSIPVLIGISDCSIYNLLKGNYALIKACRINTLYLQMRVF